MEHTSPVEWLHRQGHHVIKTNSSFWYDIGPKVYQAFPYHQLIAPSSDEIRAIFRQSKAIALRYSTAIDQPEGQISYHVVYDRDHYELASLPKKARHDVTRGLQYASCEPIPLMCLATEGWRLREETLVRQGRRKAESRLFWETLCLSADGLPCYEAWGALHEGKLVAALLACTIDDTVAILYQQSMTQHLQFGINNALTYVFTREVLHRPGIRCIFYGLQSLDAPPSVDQFKFRMEYFPRPVKQRVVFHPIFALLVQPLGHRLIKLLLKVVPSSSRMAKAGGLVRTYLQGKHVLAEQEWPDVLLKQKESILALACQKMDFS